MPKRRKTNARVKSLIEITSAPRNPYNEHPLMKKGGVHQKSKKALRAKSRRETQQLSLDWDSFLSLLSSVYQ